MKISYNWLKEYVDFDASPEQLADDLSLFGHEVESIEEVGDDSVLDFEITPNRGDCLSILGIAREIAALYNLKVKSEKLKVEVKSEKSNKNIQVKIEKSEICPRFTARIIDNIKIGESPKWLQEKLATYGFRPINNIVDITNYIMVATGQPLHAFDWNKIGSSDRAAVSSKLMNIRLSKNGEEVMTLDGQNRVLPADAILIEDDEKIYDLAGIMGGIKSEVDENTKTIILQGAIFDPILIRKTSKFLNHVTDASYRYERGVDFDGTIAGVDLAAKLILDSCPEAKAGELIDQINQPQEVTKIPFKIYDINHLLGTDITIDQAEEYLKRLNIKVETKTEGGKVQMIAIPPSYRVYDVKIWQDIAEEVARMKGYNQLDKSQILNLKSQNKNKEFIKREKIKDQLKEFGFTEIYSYSFIDKKQADILGIDVKELPEIEKPLSPEAQYLRPSLLSSLLTAISKNPWAPEVNIFEIGKVFSKDSSANYTNRKSAIAERGPAPSGEKWQLGIAVVGKKDQILTDAKSKLKINAETKSIDQKILDAYKIRRPVKIVIRDLEDVEDVVGEYSEEISDKKYKKISAFPPTVRDIAFLVDKDLDAKKIGEEIQNTSDKILFTELFDEFESEKFGEGKKNLAYHIWLQDLKRPMKDDEVKKIIKEIGQLIIERYQAKIRA
jgi:phenylalanyl-tRNA synthetase beta chain